MFISKLAERNRRITELTDYTNVWVDFLQRAPKEMKGVGFAMRRIGGTGSGKTCRSTENANILVTANPNFYIALNRPPEGAIELFERFCYPNLKGKFEPFERYERLSNQCYVLYDEGAILANAKRAFEKEMLDIEENAAVTRQHDWIIDVNCQDDGIIRKFREKAGFTEYKRVGKNYTNYQQHNPFVKEHKNELNKLKRPVGYFENGLPHLNYEFVDGKMQWAEEGLAMDEGMLNMDYHTYCPWWNEDISRLWGSAKLNQQRQKRMHKIWLENAIKLQKSYSGKEIKNIREYAVAFFMLEDMRNGTGELEYIEPEISHISALAKNLDTIVESNELNTILTELGIAVPEKENVPVGVSNTPTIESSRSLRISSPVPYENMTFPDYVKLQLWGTTPKEHEWADMVRQFLEGISQGEIQNYFGGTMGLINQNLYQFRVGEMGYLFEKWVNYILGTNYEAPQNSDAPDCIANDYAISCKCIVTTAKTVTFYQNAEMDEQSKCKRLRPEYLYSLQHDHQPYYLLEYNPWWRLHKLTYRMVDPDEDDRIVFGPGQPECSDWNLNSFRKEIGIEESDEDFDDATTDENWELTVEPSIPDQEID